jgi:hypothetical protein
MIFREMRDTVTTTRITVVDLQANVKVKMSPSKEMTHITLEDLKLEQAGYFYELFNDTVVATGRTEKVMGQTCEVLLGANSNKDTTTYYRTTVHPKLFADLKVWAVWLCREGNLEYLSAFSDRNAGSSLRVTWKDQGYSTPAGDWWFERITPGKQPMPVLPWRPNQDHRRTLPLHQQRAAGSSAGLDARADQPPTCREAPCAEHSAGCLPRLPPTTASWAPSPLKR